MDHRRAVIVDPAKWAAIISATEFDRAFTGVADADAGIGTFNQRRPGRLRSGDGNWRHFG
ncbi:MAG: hypothetical protein R2932_21530 [Caldilineaceae bacterium]